MQTNTLVPKRKKMKIIIIFFFLIKLKTNKQTFCLLMKIVFVIMSFSKLIVHLFFDRHQVKNVEYSITSTHCFMVQRQENV
jgi:hypothetical protein